MIVLNDRIFLKKDKNPDKIGSIYIPENGDKKAPPYTGTVKYVGKGITDDDIKPGVRLAFQDLAGDEVNIGDEKLIMIRYRQVCGILNDL